MPGDVWDAEGRLPLSSRAVLLVPVAVALVIQVPAAIAVAVWAHPPWPIGLLGVIVALASSLALLAAPRLPGPTVVVVALLTFAAVFIPPGYGPPFIPLIFAIVSGVVRGARQWALGAVGAAWVAAVIVGTMTGLDWHPYRIAFVTLLLVACFLIGEAFRSRIERARRARARLAARRRTTEQAERTRMARELHDVLAHSLSQISVQSGMALHLFDKEPERAREALESIRALSGAGLDEVRGVLGFLRGDEDAPVSAEPQLADIPELASSRSGLGLVVSVDPLPDGPRPSRPVQAAAYRIAHEALANVVRHSGGTTAVVRLERAGDLLVLTVDDDGTGIPEDRRPGAGMSAMRAQAELVGGTVEFASRPGGGARVVATLPWDGAE